MGMKRSIIIVLATICVIFSLVNASQAQYHGIWKDTETGNTHNFYIQHYSTGSTVVIYTIDAIQLYSFLGALSGAVSNRTPWIFFMPKP